MPQITFYVNREQMQKLKKAKGKSTVYSFSKRSVLKEVEKIIREENNH